MPLRITGNLVQFLITARSLHVDEGLEKQFAKCIMVCILFFAGSPTAARKTASVK